MGYSENIKATIKQENNLEMDAAGRKRVSLPHSLGEYSNVEGLNTDLFDFAGTGTQSYEDLTDNVPGNKMVVTAGQYCIGESIYAHSYKKGYSQMFATTFQNIQNEVGVIKMVGYYSSSTIAPHNTEYDGLYFESDGDAGTYSMVLVRKGTEVTRVERANWLDKLDGTGDSGLTIDFSVFNILECDFLWLGGRGFRASLAVGNTFVNIVNHSHAGNVKGTITRSPNQPIRYEIRSTTGTGHLYNICSNVTTEGNLNSIGLPKLVQIRDRVRANTIGVSYLIVAIRLNTLKRNSVITLEDFGVASTTSDSYTFRIVKNPLINGNTANSELVWNDLSPTSAIQHADIDTINNPSLQVVTGGDEWRGVNVDSRSPSGQGSSSNTLNQLSRGIAGVSDVICLVATPNSSNARLTGSINLNENIL